MTLATKMANRDQAAFVGRRQEIATLDCLFVEDPPASVVLIHGPGGIGKSTLLRELERRGRRAGWTPVFVEGRDIPPVPDAVDDALAAAHRFERPLVLIDTYERMSAVGGHLRRSLLPSLPDRTIVVVAGRRPPERGWLEGGWESLAIELPLEPLSDEESHELLSVRGLGADSRAEDLAALAGGSPLALSLAAEAAQADPEWSPANSPQPREMVRGLVRRLAEAELDGAHRDALAVACIARVTTRELLREVLPETDAAEALDWLESRTFAEPLGRGITLHDLVRRVLRADLRQAEPERERELRRRIADHLHANAVAGELMLTIDLAELVETPQIRAFYGWEGAARNRIDSLREDDTGQVALLLASLDMTPWWETTRRLFGEAPELVSVARDSGDALCGYSVSVTPASAPPAARDDVLLGPWLEDAARRVPDGNVVLWRDAVDFTRDPSSAIQGMVNMSGILRSGLANPRYAYLPIDTDHAGALEFSAVLGAEHLAHLDIEVGRKRIECHLLDYGPGGLLGAQRDVVYMELGLQPPEAGAQPEEPPVSRDDVRQALRSLRLPHELARSPLAEGESAEERVASVRARLEEASQGAFGDTENERLLQRVLVRGYLDPAPSHEQAANELNLSRAAYFRRLKLASQRVAEHLAG